jgi:anti-sigma regulatory factor (Ser/Thr protein kinase)
MTPHLTSPGRWQHVNLDASVHAIREAREQVRAFVRGAGVEADAVRLGDLELLVSEVVSNAVLHSGTPDVVVSVRTSEPVRIQVEDHGDGVPAIAPAPAVGGLGLRLVDTLASEWGVSRLDHGKIVWFEFPLAPRR